MNPQRIKPGPGRESVCDYPRPPCVEDLNKQIQVVFAGVVIADTERAKRVPETIQPSVYYIPVEDVGMEYLDRTSLTSWCEWKGQASYYNIVVGDRQPADAARFYPAPHRAYETIRNHVAFYPQQMDTHFRAARLWCTCHRLRPFEAQSVSHRHALALSRHKPVFG